MEFIALLGEDTDNWGQIAALINKGEWEKVILIKTNPKNFPIKKDCEAIELNTSQSLTGLKKDMIDKLKPKLNELEVALSIVSGTGKENMALISALLSIPVGIRLVAYTKKGIEFIN